MSTLIYTSGTTGKPKGVMLSHSNLVSNALESSKRFPIIDGDTKALSFLPLCHVFERMIIYLYQYRGVSIYYVESIDKIVDNINEISPSVMASVPRVLEKVYDKIIAKGTDLKGIKKKLFFWAVEIGLQYEPYGQNGWWYEKKLAIARKLIFSKWKASLGGNLSLIASGGAAFTTAVGTYFQCSRNGSNGRLWAYGNLSCDSCKRYARG